MPAAANTFGRRVIDFYTHIRIPDLQRFNVGVISLHHSVTEQRYTEEFYRKFYNENKKRIFIFGINPGRFGSGVTGIPFTDPIALEKFCGIQNTLEKRKELSSEFIYQCINAFGGANRFFRNFYLTALSPIGFTKNGTNYNYYDDADFLKTIRPFLGASLQEQISLGANNKVAIILGTGKNLKIFADMNNEYQLFQEIHALEHPRYIMQYQRKNIQKYIAKYLHVLKEVLP